jgi:hypothetical protein
MSYESIVQPDTTLSGIETRGLSRMVLAIRSREPAEKEVDYNQKLCRLAKLFPFFRAVQVGYDTSGSRTNTSPLSTYAKVVRASMPKRVILDTRFARDSHEGMIKDFIDYEKEMHEIKRKIRSSTIEQKKQDRNWPGFILGSPDEITIDVDMKTSVALISESFSMARNLGSGITAVIGTSRKPHSQYNIDVVEHEIGLVDTLLASKYNFRRNVITGIASSRKLNEYCEPLGVSVSCTGASLTQYDPDGLFSHAEARDLRDYVDLDVGFIFGSVMMGNKDPYDVALGHAVILGEE